MLICQVFGYRFLKFKQQLGFIPKKDWKGLENASPSFFGIGARNVFSTFLHFHFYSCLGTKFRQQNCRRQFNKAQQWRLPSAINFTGRRIDRCMPVVVAVVMRQVLTHNIHSLFTRRRQCFYFCIKNNFSILSSQWQGRGRVETTNFVETIFFSKFENGVGTKNCFMSKNAFSCCF